MKLFFLFFLLYPILSQQYEKIQVDNTTRQYLIHLPNRTQNFIPLVLALHGAGGSARQYERDSGWVQVGKQYQVAIVFPDGTGLLPEILHTWNSGYCCGYAYRNKMNDVKFIQLLISHLLQKHPFLDKRRVYITGHSNGGMMTYRIAAELSEMITAAAPVSGTIGGKENRDAPQFIIPIPKIPVPILHVHGKLDDMIPIEGGYYGDRYDMSMKQAIDFWIKANQCANQSSRVISRNGKIQLERFEQCKGNIQVMGYVLLEQGHKWDEMSSEVTREEFYGKSLAESIWNLIKQFVK